MLCRVCDTYGPSARNAKWIIKTKLKLVYIETMIEELVAATIDGGQCNISTR